MESQCVFYNWHDMGIIWETLFGTSENWAVWFSSSLTSWQSVSQSASLHLGSKYIIQPRLPHFPFSISVACCFWVFWYYQMWPHNSTSSVIEAQKWKRYYCLITDPTLSLHMEKMRPKEEKASLWQEEDLAQSPLASVARTSRVALRIPWVLTMCKVLSLIHHLRTRGLCKHLHKGLCGVGVVA